MRMSHVHGVVAGRRELWDRKDRLPQAGLSVPRADRVLTDPSCHHASVAGTSDSRNPMAKNIYIGRGVAGRGAGCRNKEASR